MKLADRIWLAAILDTEGTICLGKTNRKDTRTPGVVRVHPTYSALLMVTNTYLPLLERAKALMGSPEMIQKKKAAAPNARDGYGRKTCYQVFLRNRSKMLAVLRDVEPHLMEKRELARRLIGWLEWFERTRVTPEGHRMSIEARRDARAEYEARAEHVREAHSGRMAA